jgi:hypothetical protein
MDLIPISITKPLIKNITDLNKKSWVVSVVVVTASSIKGFIIGAIITNRTKRATKSKMKFKNAICPFFVIYAPYPKFYFIFGLLIY